MAATVGSLLKYMFRALAAGAVEDPRTESEWLLEDLLQLPRTQLYLQRGMPVPADAEERARSRIKRRLAGEPVQYIVGKVPFMNCTLHVNGSVLIPRPETEILAEQALERLRPGMTVLDIGTGSGALAVALAAGCCGCMVTAVDISDDALAVARINARENGVEDAVRFIHADFSEEDAVTGVYDMVVTNPPYIRSADVDTLQYEVRGYEPRIALDGGTDGFDFYRILGKRAGALITPGGSLLAEVGAGQATAVAAMLTENGSMAQGAIVPDYAGIERVVITERKKN